METSPRRSFIPVFICVRSNEGTVISHFINLNNTCFIIAVKGTKAHLHHNFRFLCEMVQTNSEFCLAPSLTPIRAIKERTFFCVMKFHLMEHKNGTIAMKFNYDKLRDIKIYDFR